MSNETQPSTSQLATLQGSYVTPAFEHARVSDAMRAGVITCADDTSFRTVARMMATHHIHSVVVTRPESKDAVDERPWGVVSDIDVVRAASPDAEYRTAGEVAATEVVSVDESAPLEHAARLMSEHEVSHLIVVDSSGTPVGVVSSLDVAGVLAWGRS